MVLREPVGRPSARPHSHCLAIAKLWEWSHFLKCDAFKYAEDNRVQYNSGVMNQSLSYIFRKLLNDVFVTFCSAVFSRNVLTFL